MAVQPLERNEQTMDHMKRLIVFICYFLALLNNTKITVFKFDFVYYLNSIGMSNEGLNTMANFGVITIIKAVDCRKKKISNLHKKYIKNTFVKYSEKAFVLNVDNYHNIHV